MKENEMTAQTHTIRESTQLVLDDVRIAAGNLACLKRVDEQGVSQKGITAMLWVLVAGQPAQRARVHAGQDVRAAGVRIHVIDIGVRDGWGFIRLTVDRE
jgi:hypothetical protein